MHTLFPFTLVTAGWKDTLLGYVFIAIANAILFFVYTVSIVAALRWMDIL